MTIWRCNPCKRWHLCIHMWKCHWFWRCKRCQRYLIPGMGVYYSVVWKKP